VKNLDLVILAGGRGTRIKNLTRNKPKPLIKFGKKSFLQNLINSYAKYNFDKIYILAGYKGRLIKKKFNNKSVNLTSIKCIVEKRLKGTGGALNELRNKNINNFILTNGDSYCSIDLTKFLEKTKKKLIKMSLVKNLNYKSNNTLNNLNVRKGRVYFDPKSKYMNAGIYYLNKSNIKFFNKKSFSFENDYLKKMIHNKKVYGQIFPEQSTDIGTPKNLIRAKKFLPKIFKKNAAFLDRDGVINHDRGYVHNMNKFRFKKNVIKGLRYLVKKNYYIFIITNQSGIARNYYSEESFINFQKNINEKLIKKKIFINDVSYCPHHNEGVINKYKINCKCRKPKTQMLKNTLIKFEIDKTNSFFIGDSDSDKKCAENFGLKFHYSNKDFFKTCLKAVNR
jgi:D,D-heptose 1,7-bisphosphate phosphatase